eukprot:7894106-Lingulodinium_polyedra.AAC.1
MPAQSTACIACAMPCLHTRTRDCLLQAPAVRLHCHVCIEVFGNCAMCHGCAMPLEWRELVRLAQTQHPQKDLDAIAIVA